MKIIHTADLHIGAKFVKFGLLGKELRMQIKNTLEKIAEECIHSKVQLIVFAGDVFDSPYPSSGDVAFVRNVFRKISDNNTWIIVVPGNHDRLEDGSVWSESEWGEIENLHVFNTLSREYYIESLKTFVYANATFLQFSEISPLLRISEIIKENKKVRDAYHIVIGHGNLRMTNGSTNFPIDKCEIVELSADYVALGDWHSLLRVNSNSKEITEYKYDRFTSPAFYSGSPEIVDMDQKGAGNIIQIELDQNSVSVRTRKVGKRFVDEIVIQLESIASLDKLMEKICLGANVDLIRSVVLDGLSSFEIDTEELKENLKGKFWNINIVKKFRNPKIDISKLEEGTVLGNFVKMMNEAIANSPDDARIQDALDLGLEYLNNLSK